MNLSKLDTTEYIIIKGARVNNLKDIDVVIPRNKFIVITGLSGSGKSSLAFDTLYAEGQRRYVESLSSYARQFLGRMNKPEVDYIKGISPAIAIEQKVNTRNPRSTVGTSTEIYEYLKLLFARIGQTYSPVSGALVKKHSVSDVVEYILTLPEDSRIIIYSPVKINKERGLKQQLIVLLQQGFSRILLDDYIVNIEDVINKPFKPETSDFKLIIDRLSVKHDDDEFSSRLADSLQTAFYEGEGDCVILTYSKDRSRPVPEDLRLFTNKFEDDGLQFEEPTANLFSFNNPYGACKTCEGFGNVMGIDEDLVVPDKTLSVFEGAIVCWHGEKMNEWKEDFIMHSYKYGFPVHKPYNELSAKHKELLWKGKPGVEGLNDFFKMLEENNYKIQYRVMLSRYRGKTTCPDCNGTRLRKEATYVKVDNKDISELVTLPVTKLIPFFKNINLNDYDKQVSKRILIEINNRLHYLNDVGLGYLTLNRLSSSLSGGESQRINLATSLGNNLVGSMYILDEPSIGLHPRDTHRLIEVLKKLRDLGNTVMVVEHDEEIMRASDYIIDLGPEAGVHGGEVVFMGKLEELLSSYKKDGHSGNKVSLTAEYLNKHKFIEVPTSRKKWKEFIEVKGAKEHNLKNIDVKFPLNAFTVVTGVSGSGKTTLVKQTLYTALRKTFDNYSEKVGFYKKLDGDIKRIGNIEFVDQNPIGRSSRSNPATYLKAYDEIRQLYADQSLSKARSYKPGFFSFNIEGGRCEECEGDGVVKISMQFMADVYLICESCGGKRFKEEVLDIQYKGKNISEILEMTIDQAIEFFSDPRSHGTLERKIAAKLLPLQDVGLGYLQLGQSSSTLSGGEAQRVKLAFFLVKGTTEKPTLFIFDEPTTGLHFHDISKLYKSFKALLENGHSIIVIEHNMEIIKCADWIIDLGPEGGEEGGYLVFQGTPEDLITNKESYTAKYLKQALKLKD